MYKYLGSTLFGIWVAQGKQSICFPFRCPNDTNCSFTISNPSIAHLGIMGAKQEDIIRPHFPISCEPFNLFLSLWTNIHHLWTVRNNFGGDSHPFVSSINGLWVSPYIWIVDKERRWRTYVVLAVFPTFPSITSCNFGGRGIIIYDFLIVMMVESSMYDPFASAFFFMV
jgi:hypothetical protein